MRVIFHRQARSDLTIILKYYEEISGRETANEFLGEMRNCVNKISQRPESFPLVNEILRRASLKRFPYHVLFYRIDKGIRVVSVKHDRRHPSIGRGRR